MGLPELALKIMFWMLFAGLIGWIVGFLLGRILGSANATELLNDCEGRMRLRDQELNGLRSDLTASTAKIGLLETEMITLAATLKTRENWVTELEGKNDGLQADLNARISELDELRRESDSLRSHTTEVQKDDKSVPHPEQNSLHLALAAKERELTQALFRLKNLESKMDEVKKSEEPPTSLAEAKTSSNARDVEIAHLRLRLSELEPLVVEVQQREAKVRQLNAQLASLAAEQDHLRYRVAELEPLALQLQEAQGRLQEWDSQTKQKEAELSRLKVRVTELEMMAREVKAPVVKVSQASALPPSPKERDDLKKIFGIGPALEKLLNSHGIYWFRQIAEWSPQDIHRYDELLEDFRGRIERDKWIVGAKEEHLKKYGEQL
ncbi:MAG: hypothetical protein JNM09_04590 [Blastocatellia bacterium]|nr:hypothetical protein [Blastocatellia bacterium]